MIGLLSHQVPLRRRLLGRERLIGTFCGLGSAAAAEVCAAAGAQWVLVDLEHGLGGEATLAATVPSAAAYGVPVLARVETHDRIRVGRVLDAGAAGIMVPRIESAANAANAVRNLHYPPTGIRGVATYNRAARFGLDPSALQTAAEELACLIQIESVSALEQVDDIAALDGVDGLFVGPADLSYALGYPLQFDHPDFIEALERVVHAAEHANITAGIMAGNPGAAQQHLARGFNFISLASDASYLAACMRTGIQEIHSAP
jgi:4-hydroxy-2-oxoheptanedioate aldolase